MSPKSRLFAKIVEVAYDVMLFDILINKGCCGGLRARFRNA